MSDSTEKPKGSSGKYSSFPGEPVFTDSIPSDQDDGYKSVSILAILGAVLGGLFVLTLSGDLLQRFLLVRLGSCLLGLFSGPLFQSF